MASFLTGAVIALVGYVVGYRVCLWRHHHWQWMCVECRRTPVDSPLAVCGTCFINGGPL